MRADSHLSRATVAAVVCVLAVAAPATSATWRHVARFVLEPCEADHPSIAACPRAASPAFQITSKLWRFAGRCGQMVFISVWSAVTPPRFLKPLRTEICQPDPHRGTPSYSTYYFPGPGRFFLFSSSIDIAVQVSVAESR